MDIGYEIGEERGMFHAHALLTIDHIVPGKGIHLDPRRFLSSVLQNVSTPELRGRNMYVNIKGFPSLASARGYIYKNASSLSAAQMAALVRRFA